MTNRREHWFWWERDPLGNWRPRTTDKGDPDRWPHPPPSVVAKQRINADQFAMGVVKLAKEFSAPIQMQKQFNRPRR